MSFVGTNLVLVALLFCVAVLMGRWKEGHGEILTAFAVAKAASGETTRLPYLGDHVEKVPF